jgi:hypothetical protein
MFAIEKHVRLLMAKVNEAAKMFYSIDTWRETMVVSQP